MYNSAIVLVAVLLIVLAVAILILQEVFGTLYIRPKVCPSSFATHTQLRILESMNRSARPPIQQPVYKLARSVPKDAVTHQERSYIADGIRWFSSGKLTLLDIENVMWMAESDTAPIVCMLDARVNITESHEVIRVSMMWCERDLWVVKLANGKGCFKSPIRMKECIPLVGSLANRPIYMAEQYGMKSLIGRKQTFEWDTTGVLKTDPETNTTPMINTAYTQRPPELLQNPTFPPQNRTESMFLKTFGIPQS